MNKKSKDLRIWITFTIALMCEFYTILVLYALILTGGRFTSDFYEPNIYLLFSEFFFVLFGIILLICCFYIEDR